MLSLIKPFDIVVFDAVSKNILHDLIEWRSIDAAVHCAVVKDTSGRLYDPDFKGIVETSILDYASRYKTIVRYNRYFDDAKLAAWCDSTVAASTGYDYKQWLFGFVLGIAKEKLANDPNKWTCAEFPYWMFQENGYKLTLKDELLPMPRLFKFNTNFNLVYKGK